MVAAQKPNLGGSDHPRPSSLRAALLASCAAIAIAGLNDVAVGQIPLPEIRVNEPKPPPAKRTAKRTGAHRRAIVRRPATPPPTDTTTAEQPVSPSGTSAIATQVQKFNAARARLLPRTGANSYDIGHEAVEALPQGTNAPLEKVLLQAPGVYLDSAASGSLHIRNEHANVQYRINGILLPDGVAGLGQVVETGFIGNIALLTGALPAQYGLHTAAVVDITSRSGAFDQGGSISMYGGSRQTITPSFEYGGTIGQTEYFISGRYFASNEGIENPTSSLNPLHDYTQQSKFFGYASTLIDDNTRLSFITGTAVTKFQIPDVPGQTPNFTAFGVSNFDSATVDENQMERNYFNVVALQKTVGNIDFQTAYFSRYSTVHFVPDQLGDLIFNGVASDVYRSSLLQGIQSDVGVRVNDAHTLRGGVSVSAERTQVVNGSVAIQTDAGGNPLDVPDFPPISVVDANTKVGWLIGSYVQDEWKLTEQLTLNAGIRFDQMYQFVDANQFSPRVNLVYKPFEGTTIHMGYASNFTPPSQVVATPTNLALLQNTTQLPAVLPSGEAPVSQNDPVRPERSQVYDVGIVQKLMPGLEVGLDYYHKDAKDLLDDGQFGQALVLNGFNYEKGKNDGVELKATYQSGGFRAYGNLAWAIQMGKNPVSNEFLFDPDRLAFIQSNWIFTDHSQLWSASAGVSLLVDGTRLSTDMIYGSGLRSGFANTDHVPPYAQINAGVSHEFQIPDGKPVTLRFDVVNVFDTIYEIRDGTGIGVFAPQFGPRRGYYVGLSQRL